MARSASIVFDLADMDCSVEKAPAKVSRATGASASRVFDEIIQASIDGANDNGVGESLGMTLPEANLKIAVSQLRSAVATRFPTWGLSLTVVPLTGKNKAKVRVIFNVKPKSKTTVKSPERLQELRDLRAAKKANAIAMSQAG